MSSLFDVVAAVVVLKSSDTEAKIRDELQTVIHVEKMKQKD